MSPLAFLPYLAAQPVQRAWLRQLAAAALQRTSLALARSAQHLAAAAPSAASAPDADVHCVEFHAEAGALEGALYVDGQLVAMLPGVSRL
jgi:hypothetical protein